MAPTNHNQELAMQHALLIQQRKEMESTILSSIETLMEYPPSKSSDPLHPTPNDLNQVKELLKPFQPSDYDSLVQERNINGLCGYVFCPRPHKAEKTDAKYRILYPKVGNSLRVVETKDLEKWCSHDCELRSYFIRLQLLDTPAWERTHANDFKLELYDPKKPGPDLGSSSKGTTSAVPDHQKLAIERGELNKNELGAKGLDIQVHEHEGSDGHGTASAKVPEITLNDGDGQAIEGHVPREYSQTRLPIRSRTPKSKPT